MPLPAQITTHVDDAKALLISQFQGKPNINNVLAAWVGSFQDLETVAWDVLNAFVLATAVGHQLDILGLMVGELRLGRGDTEYRDAISVRVLINKSHGTADDVIEVVKLIWPSYVYYEQNRASFQVWTYSTPLIKIHTISQAIRQTRPIGVKAHYMPGTLSQSSYIIPSSTAGATVLSQGYGSTTAPTLIKCMPHVVALT